MAAAAISACDSSVSPTAPAPLASLKPRANASGPGYECMSVTYAGWMPAPNIQGLPDGGWTAIAYIIGDSGPETMVQGCYYPEDGYYDMGFADCYLMQDWNTSCIEDQLPQLGPTYVGSWLEMPASTWWAGEDLGGGGGSAVPPNPTNIAYGRGYCPNSHPDCLKPLESIDRSRIDSALNKIDTTSAICKEAFVKFKELYSLNVVFRGNLNIPDDPGKIHDGMTRPGQKPFMHIDQDVLREGQLSYLVSVIVHEAWHLLYPPHTEETLPYTTYPYSIVVSCVL